jgi:hypothetical protein
MLMIRRSGVSPKRAYEPSKTKKTRGGAARTAKTPGKLRF